MDIVPSQTLKLKKKTHEIYWIDNFCKVRENIIMLLTFAQISLNVVKTVFLHFIDHVFKTNPTYFKMNKTWNFKVNSFHLLKINIHISQWLSPQSLIHILKFLCKESSVIRAAKSHSTKKCDEFSAITSEKGSERDTQFWRWVRISLYKKITKQIR